MRNKKILNFTLLSLSFLLAGFVAYSWDEPAGSMPGNYVMPINTSDVAQYKDGEIGAQTFRDSDDLDYYIDPSGSSVVSGKIVMQDSTASNDVPETVATKGYVDTEIARVESLVNGSLPLVYNMHTRQACEDAGGEVFDSDVSLPMCKFNTATCPENWTPYKNFTETVPSIDCCCSCSHLDNCWCENPDYVSNVTSGSHSWGNILVEESPLTQQRCWGEWRTWSCPAYIVQIGCY